MKFLRFLPIAAIACAAVSCQNGSGSLSENSSQTDSLMYYLGQMHATDYLREAQRDTVMKETSEKDAYIAGVKAGLAALKEGNDNYNKGVMMGMQMASQIMSFTEQMDLNINKNAYINSLQSALMADTIPNGAIVQSEFRTVMQHIQDDKEARDKAASQETLQGQAQKNGMPKINDDLYGKVTEANNDTISIAKGDEINLTYQIKKEDGEILNYSLPAKIKVGNRRIPEVVSDALVTMKNGETGEFLTSAHALLGRQVQQYDLKPADVLSLTLTPTVVPKEEPKEENK